MSQRENQINCDVTDDNILITPALNTRTRRPVVMNMQIRDKQQHLIYNLLDKDLRTTSFLKGTKIQSLQEKDLKTGSLRNTEENRRDTH